MAWLLHQAPEGFAIVPCIVEPPLRDRRIPREWFQERGILPLGDGATGFDVPESAWPKRARLKTKRKALPHITNFSNFYAMSQTAKRVIEAIEPNVHDFRLVDVIQQDGTKYPESYFAFNCRKRFDNIVLWDETTAYSTEIGAVRKFKRPYPRERVVIDSERVRGAHFWLTLEMIGTALTVSDELFSHLEVSKLLRGIEPSPFIEM